jgi:hypothetical protein
MYEDNPTIEHIVSQIIDYAKDTAGPDFITKVNTVMNLVNLSVITKFKRYHDAQTRDSKAHFDGFWEVRGNWGRIDTFRKEHTRK